MPPHAATLFTLLLAAGCAAPHTRGWDGRDYPGELRRAEAFTPDGLWRQRVTAFWGEGEERGFDAALQVTDRTLTVLGLSPMGSMGFAIVLRDGEVEIRNETSETLAIPPRFVLLDVQRCFYPWLAASEAFALDGEYEGEVDGEQVVERRAGGRLRERVFRRLDGDPEGEIRVTYEWDREDWHVPTRVELDNGWFGYRLRVETHEETLLGEAAP